MFDEDVVEYSHIQHGLVEAWVAALGGVGWILEGDGWEFFISSWFCNCLGFSLMLVGADWEQ